MKKVSINGIIFPEDNILSVNRRTYGPYEEFNARDVDDKPYLINYYPEEGEYYIWRLERVRGDGNLNYLES